MNERLLLVMFVGGPGSGKTTFARLFGARKGGVVINSDAIRVSMWGSKEVARLAHTNPKDRAYGNQLTFGALDYAAGQILAAGHSVVYDANANKPDERLKLIKIAQANGAIPVVVRLKTPADIAVRRIVERQDVHDQNQHDEVKARDIVESFRLSIVEPTDTENIIEISGEVSFDEQYAAFERLIGTFLRG